MNLRAPILAAALLLPAACAFRADGPAGASPVSTAEYRVQRHLIYTPADWPQQRQADLWLPRGPGPHPAVLLVHGGGWERGTRSDMDDIAERLARRGYAAVSVSYRFAPEHLFPAPLHDLQQALRWMRAHAEQYGFDPRRIAAWGYSAGGQLAALLGVIGGNDALDAPHGGEQARVRAVVAGGTPFDLSRYENSPLTSRYLGATREENPALHALASPITHVSPGDAPMFIYHAGWDAVVPLEPAEAMKAALDAAQVPAELFVVKDHGHFTLFLLDQASAQAAIDFLDRHLR